MFGYLYMQPVKNILGLKVETDNPNTLNNGTLEQWCSISVAEKIVAWYVRKLVGF